MICDEKVRCMKDKSCSWKPIWQCSDYEWPHWKRNTFNVVIVWSNWSENVRARGILCQKETVRRCSNDTIANAHTVRILVRAARVLQITSVGHLRGFRQQRCAWLARAVRGNTVVPTTIVTGLTRRQAYWPGMSSHTPARNLCVIFVRRSTHTRAIWWPIFVDSTHDRWAGATNNIRISRSLDCSLNQRRPRNKKYS